MISFAGTKNLYVKGTCNVILTNVANGNILYQSEKFNTGSITSSVSMNEIRAGLGNPIAAIIPSDSGLAVEFSAANFSLWEKAAQVGATMSYNAPVPQCQTVTATSASISVDISAGAPTAQVGFTKAYCQVQHVGASSDMSVDGTAYEINESTGAISGFTATSGEKYKVWYFTKKASAQMATLGSMFDPKVVHFTAQLAVYANDGSAVNEGTRVGWLYVVVPYLKLQANANITGDQGSNDSTVISGQAIAYDSDIVQETCSDCEQSKLAYYIYCPDNASVDIRGLAVVGGTVSCVASSTKQIPVKFVMADGSLVSPSSFGTGFTATATGAPTGTTVSNACVITAGATTGDFDITITYTGGYTCAVAASIVSA